MDYEPGSGLSNGPIQIHSCFFIPDPNDPLGRVEINYAEERDQSDTMYMNKAIGAAGSRVERLTVAAHDAIRELAEAILEEQHPSPDFIQRGEGR